MSGHHNDPSTPVDDAPSDTEREEDRLIGEAAALSEEQQRRLLASDQAVVDHLWAIGADTDAATVRWFRREVREALARQRAAEGVDDEADTWPGVDLDFDRKEAAENAA